MVCLDDQTLCKPMSEREHLIYTTMPDVLRPFVPAFHGVMKVHVREKEDGYIELIGHPPPQFRRSQATKPYQKRLSLYKSNSFVDAEPRESFCNPWALKVSKSRPWLSIIIISVFYRHQSRWKCSLPKACAMCMQPFLG